jgi:GxxExxY protein
MVELVHQEITQAIIGAAFEVHKVLGYGFLERVYQKSMQVELISRGFRAEIEFEISVQYKGVEVGFYKADLLVNKLVLVELKIAKTYAVDDEPQLLNELKATGIKVGLLINFGKSKVDFNRFAY